MLQQVYVAPQTNSGDTPPTAVSMQHATSQSLAPPAVLKSVQHSSVTQEEEPRAEAISEVDGGLKKSIEDLTVAMHDAAAPLKPPQTHHTDHKAKHASKKSHTESVPKDAQQSCEEENRCSHPVHRFAGLSGNPEPEEATGMCLPNGSCRYFYV